MGNLQFCDDLCVILDELNHSKKDSDNWNYATIAIIKSLSIAELNFRTISRRLDKMELELRVVTIAVKEANSETANRLEGLNRELSDIQINLKMRYPDQPRKL